ncbi:MAG: carbohydrate binding domain-containing protein [Candidatus Margulisiibacteriota bacterium]
MKSPIITGFLLFLLMLPAGAVMVDDFNDGEFKKIPEWWTFDKVTATVTKNPAKSGYALMIKGAARDWYVGGLGTYIAKDKQDLSKASTLDLDIYGFGPDSGTLKIELYDDDNGNWQIEQDNKTFNPIYDDRFAYELKIDWKGWKHISLPLAEFVDTNNGAGDNVWNPQQTGSSGGLLQMQIISIAASKTGKVNYVLDNVEFREGKRK